MSTILITNFILSTLFLSLCKEAGSSLTYASIFWTEHNHIFNEEQGEQCMNVVPQSNIPIICPFQGLTLQTQDEQVSIQQLYENFIMVDRYGYENCIYDKTKPGNTTRYLWSCDDPQHLKPYSLIFTTYSASSDGLEFTPGRYYYFISTSKGTKDSLNNTEGGHCTNSKNRLRLKVYVCYNQGDCDRNTRCSMVHQNPDIIPVTAKRTGHSNTCAVQTEIIIVIVVLAVLLVLALGVLARVLTQDWKSSKEKKSKPSSSQNGTATRHKNPISNGSSELNNIKTQRAPKGSESSYPILPQQV